VLRAEAVFLSSTRMTAAVSLALLVQVRDGDDELHTVELERVCLEPALASDDSSTASSCGDQWRRAQFCGQLDDRSSSTPGPASSSVSGSPSGPASASTSSSTCAAPSSSLPPGPPPCSLHLTRISVRLRADRPQTAVDLRLGWLSVWTARPRAIRLHALRSHSVPALDCATDLSDQLPRTVLLQWTTDAPAYAVDVYGNGEWLGRTRCEAVVLEALPALTSENISLSVSDPLGRACSTPVECARAAHSRSA
jgi:hypothetical protein